MNTDYWQSIIINWLSLHSTQILITFVVVGAFGVLDRINTPKLEKQKDQSHFKRSSIDGAVKLARLLVGGVGLIILVMVWGIDLKHVLVLGTTMITLLGVALFASWSILSNITAFFVLVLHPAFKRGTFIRLIDADNYIEGYISEVTMFHTQLLTEDRELVLYPSNLFLGRTCIINPRNRLNVFGKITNPESQPTVQD